MPPNNNRSSEPSSTAVDTRTDINLAVDDLLNQLSSKFASVSSEIFAKLDDMNRRIDNLEARLVADEQRSSAASAKDS